MTPPLNLLLEPQMQTVFIDNDATDVDDYDGDDDVDSEIDNWFWAARSRSRRGRQKGGWDAPA